MSLRIPRHDLLEISPAAPLLRHRACCRLRSTARFPLAVAPAAKALSNAGVAWRIDLELQIAADLHALGSSPICTSRRASSSLCARNRSTFCITRRSSLRKRRYPGSDRSETRALTTATAAPERRAQCSRFGQNSLSASTSICGRKARKYARTAKTDPAASRKHCPRQIAAAPAAGRCRWWWKRRSASREARLQLFDHARDRQHLAHRHGVYPDGVFAVAFSKRSGTLPSRSRQPVRYLP